MEVPETVVTPLQQQYLKKHRQHHLFVAACRFLGFLLILTVWELASDFQLIDSFIFSSPLKVVRTIGTMWTDGSLIRHTAITLGETAASFILVILFSFLTATLLWFFHSLSEILEPWLVILNSLPKSALAPLLIVWLGASMRTIIVAGMSVAIFGSIISMYTAFCETDPEAMKLIYTLGGNRLQVMTHVVCPSSLPSVIGLCLVGVIIGEFLAAREGLGYLIIYSSQVFRLDYLIAALIILCVIAFCLYQLIQKLEHQIRKSRLS